MTIDIATERSVLVELTAEDLKKMNLTYEQIGVDQCGTENAWRKILREIKRYTGRMYSGSEVEIDMLPSKTGGCLLIVTSPFQKAEEMNSAALCFFEEEDDLLDFLSEFSRGDKDFSFELLRFKSGNFAVLLPFEKSDEHLFREFGNTVRLTGLQLNGLTEYAERLKVFCGF